MSFEAPWAIVLHLGGFALFLSLAVSGFMIEVGILDKPGPRSSHVRPTPTAGGLGIVAGLAAALFGLAVFYPNFADQRLLGGVAALVLAIGVLGLVDDVWTLKTRTKFLLVIVLALLLVTLTGPPQAFPVMRGGLAIPALVGYFGAVLWLFVMSNGVNFMDGTNGLMGLCMMIAAATLSLIALLVHAQTAAILSGALAAALVGFLPYNLRNRALIFSGDVGALTVGFVYGAATLILVREASQAGLLYLGPLLVLPFLTDIFLTLLRRALRGDNLLKPHRTHLYQRLV
ncbi:MAG TPA: hypothetical protein ENK01_00065, partial [Hellea balneolensis]|nr:hypothetical protein [Hellea balneolensis]